MYGKDQICFLCDSKGTIKRCVCNSFFKLIDNIQPTSPLISQRPFKPLDLSYRDIYNLDFKGHGALCMSLDGKWIVSGFGIATRVATKAPPSVVQIWDVENNYEYAELHGHRMSIFSLCMSADNRWIVSSGRDQTVRIWSMENKSQVAVLRGHEDEVTSVCISRDAKWIISGSGDNTIRVWSTETMSEEAVLTGHEEGVTTVCLSVDAKIIVSGSKDCTVRIWNMKNKSEVAVFNGHTDDVNCVCISSDSMWIVSGSNDKTVRLWNMSRNAQEAVFEAMYKVCSVCITHDNRLILSSGDDQRVNFWSLETKTQVGVHVGDEGDRSYVTLGQDRIWILARARRVLSSNLLIANQIPPSLNRFQRRLNMRAIRPIIIPPRANGENLRLSSLNY